MSKRSFTVVHLKSKSNGLKSKTRGRYISRSPKEAAIKAFNRECRSSKIKGRCALVLILKETTRGSKHKLYRYQMKRTKLAKPIKISKNGVDITIKYKTTGLKLKTIKPSKLMKKMVKGMKGGGGMDMDMSDDEDEGIYTGYYNIIGHDAILHTDYFLIPEEQDESFIVKQILKKHKKEFKKAGVKKIAVEIFDTMFYPREEGPSEIKQALEGQLPYIKQDMSRLNKSEIKDRKKAAFDMSDMAAMLDMM